MSDTSDENDMVDGRWLFEWVCLGGEDKCASVVRI
jgi:hypothetical protein